jgi:hypothetical protein
VNLSWVRAGKVGVLGTKKMNDRLAEIPAIEIWAQKKTPNVFARSQVHVHPALPAITTLRFHEKGCSILTRFFVRTVEGLAGWSGLLAGWSEGLAGWNEGLAGFIELLANWSELLAGWSEGLAGLSDRMANWSELLDGWSELLAGLSDGLAGMGWN